MPITLNASTASGLVVTPDNSGQIAFQNNGTTELTVNAFGIGLGTAVPSSGTGITFPAVQDPSSNANTLDDYEEGTWTPGVGAGITYVGSLITSGTYRKIGSLVYITATISGSTSITTTVAGNAYINGVPFNMAPGSAGVSACGWANATSGAGYKSGLLGYDNMYVGEAIGPTSTVLTISGVYIATN